MDLEFSVLIVIISGAGRPAGNGLQSLIPTYQCTGAAQGFVIPFFVREN